MAIQMSDFPKYSLYAKIIENQYFATIRLYFTFSAVFLVNIMAIELSKCMLKKVQYCRAGVRMNCALEVSFSWLFMADVLLNKEIIKF